MRQNHRLQRPLAILLVTLMLCMNLVLQFGIRPVQADASNLADKAVAFIKTQYQANGAQNDPSTHYPYVAYVLKSAGVDLSGWIYNSLALSDANYALVDADIVNNTVPVKHLAQDLISMQAWGNNNRVSQIQTILHNRQKADGSFQNDSNVYSIIAAYELLGRAGQLSVVDIAAAQTYILSQQNAGSGAWPDFMTTAEAVRALNYLAPGSAANSTIGLAISSACNWLKQQQKAEGRFQAALDDPLIDTAEAIATQKALGLNPAAAWTNNGKSAVDYLNNGVVNANGSLGSSQNLMDAAWALDSCKLLGILPTGSGGGGGDPTSATVRVRVEGASSNLADTSVTVSGTALNALQAAVGSSHVTAPGGFISSINGEGGHASVAADTDTAWFYYVIRNGAIDPLSLSSAANGYNVANGDQIVFYIGAYGHTTYAPKTYFPVVSISPQAPSAGQTVTLNISAQKYDYTEGLKNLSAAENSTIGNYKLSAGGTTYTSSYGQVTIPNVTVGTLSYVISNPNSAGFPNIVPYRGSLNIGAAVNSNVRVRVEGASSNLADTLVTVSGTALNALQAAVGSSHVTAPGGFISSINGEGGHASVAADTDTAWFYYVIRNGAIDPLSLSSAANGYNVANGDQIVFYIGAYGHTTYAPKTYFPVVSISPQAPSAGQTVTLNISAQKYDWAEGVKNLSSAETSAIGNYTVTIGDTTYTSSNGQVCIPNVNAGALNYVIINQNSAGYPNVVPYRAGISVTGEGGAPPSSCSPNIKVIGMNGETLFGPSNVTVPASNKWGLTVLGTLDATGLDYAMSQKWPGFVESIAGQANSGSQGWMYTVNGITPMVLSKDYTVSSSDKVIWYYSRSMDQPVPTTPGFVTSTSGNAAVNPAAGGTVALGSEAVVKIPAGALVGANAVNVVVQRRSSPSSAPAGFSLLGSVFEFSVGDSAAYKFNQPVTLSFIFDPKSLPSGQTPSIYYYDEKLLQWINLGGNVSGTTISVDVDHFTKYALFAKEITAAPAIEKNFLDVPASFWASQVIKDLYSRSYINGYPDGSFKPDNNISRAEFIAIMNKMLKLSTYRPVQADFKDVSSSDWFYESVENAVHSGIVKGYGREFLPDQEISREELATILVNALAKKDQVQTNMKEKSSFTDDASVSNWARGYVIVAAQQGLINGYPDQRFNPQGKASRAEACSMIINFLKNKTKPLVQ